MARAAAGLTSGDGEGSAGASIHACQSVDRRVYTGAWPKPLTFSNSLCLSIYGKQQLRPAAHIGTASRAAPRRIPAPGEGRLASPAGAREEPHCNRGVCSCARGAGARRQAWHHFPARRHQPQLPTAGSSGGGRCWGWRLRRRARGGPTAAQLLAAALSRRRAQRLPVCALPGMEGP